MITSTKDNASHRDCVDDSVCNPNPGCYELLAPFYEDIYERIDADETVRQWWQLLVEAKLIVDLPEALRLVDIGCGPGWQIKAWSELCFTAVGLDSSPTLLASATALLADKSKQSGLYLADILDPDSLPALLPFDLAVSHFNFLNLFAPEQRETVFRSVARLVRPGGFWMTDFAEPCFPPESVEETIPLPTGVLERKGQYNRPLDCYDQHWKGPAVNSLERFWFGHRAAAASLASRTGWRLCLRKAWRPYMPEAAWHEPNENDEVLVDVYQRMGGERR
jgi:SAM-dependent methyltransferase